MATWLGVCQAIASDIDTLEFNSIADSPEAEQIAQVVLGVYNDLITDIALRDFGGFVEATPDPQHIGRIWLKQFATEVDSVELDISADANVNKYIKLKYLSPDEFLQRFSRMIDGSKPGFVEAPADKNGNATYYLNTARWPEYYTSFDNTTLVIDATKAAYVLSSSRWRLRSDIAKTVEVIQDELAPIGLTPEAERYLVAESRARAFDWIAQEPNAKSEYEARMRKRKLSRKNTRTRSSTRFPDYGRGSQRGVGYFKDKYRGY